MAITVEKTPVEAAYSKNPLPLILSTDTVLRTANLKIGIILGYNNGVEAKEYTIELAPDADGVVVFDLAEALDGLIEEEYDITLDDSPKLTEVVTGPGLENCLCAHTIKPFTIQYYEVSGDPPTASTPEDLAADMAVVIGGVKWEYHPRTKYFEDWVFPLFAATAPKEIPFLTWQPDTKKIYKWQHEYLYFFNLDLTQMHLIVECFDTVQEIGTSLNIAIDDVGNYSIYRLPVGYNQLDIDSGLPDPFNVDSYRVAVVSNDGLTRYSAYRTFVIETKKYAHERFFLFMNSLGGWDTVRTTGEGEHNVDYKWTAALRKLDTDYNGLKPVRKIFNKTNQETFKATTGFRRKSEITWMMELVNSSRAYEILNYPTDPFLVPIDFTSKKLELFKDKNFLQYAQFEYQYSFDNPVSGPLAPWM